MKSLASLTVAMLALVALIFISQSSPVDAFTIYRIGSDADWLMSSDEGDDDDDFHYADSESEYDEEGMPQNDVAAFDQDSLDDAELVVDEDEVLPAWRGVPAEGVELAQEVVVESYTSFVIDLDDPGTPPIDPGDLKPEQFGPPTFYLANRETEDDVMKVTGHGDGLFGSLEEKDPAGKFYVFRVEYYCKTAGKSQITVEYTFFNMLEEVKNVTFTWTKTCGSGQRQGFFVDAVLGDDDSDSFPVVTDGKVEDKWLAPFNQKIPFGVHTTTFYLRMERAAGSQDYGAPVITVSHPDILQIHGTEGASYGSILTEKGAKALAITYKCLLLSEEEVIVNVKYTIGAYSPVEFGWRKSCSQVGTHQGLVISTSSSAHGGDVYTNGAVVPEWTTALHSHTVSQNTTTSMFYFSAQTFTPFTSPRLTIQPSTILRARLVGPQGTVDSRSEIWVDSSPTPLRVEYKCLQRGNAVVRLSMVATDLHDTIEFAWTKECAIYLTANRAMLIFTLAVVIVGGMLVWGYQARRKRQVEVDLARRKAVEEDQYPF
ncbi:uncharacterized protein ACA1_177530 [Acanthamoeba castellanii str. Neff]|uniref:Uncharacterized protein n=1 Tax=Acanthamoeba castellanii (strain ATCC 30010 / Neff) TaxID=1257118 RepID=L8GSJ0_ACACF|nr:uncharacterized protein ACA1_177530 [Acanthamoeba castellanii str. Neff]ELR16144.1 hypothetical protein ACA1_177530 [Acanthamoeba castellanii str. Neff]